MHRNLKPHNILVQEDGDVKISDFTLSRIRTDHNWAYTPEDPKERERSTRETRRLWYRAPEMIFRKELYSFEVDLWSIGCLMAEMALGEALFNGESEVEQLLKIFRFVGAPNGDLFNNVS
jgi:serine/threonine protein kinase